MGADFGDDGAEVLHEGVGHDGRGGMKQVVDADADEGVVNVSAAGEQLGADPGENEGAVVAAEAEVENVVAESAVPEVEAEAVDPAALFGIATAVDDAVAPDGELEVLGRGHGELGKLRDES